MKPELVKDIIQWDVRSWQKVLFYWEQNIEWDKVERALELGGREGGLSLYLALKGKQVICSDIKDVQTTASLLHSKYNVSAYIKYEDIDATNIPYENYFDIIVFKSIIGGIGRNNNKDIQQKVFDEIYKALKPGGKLLFAENLVASALHQQLRRRFIKWGDSWRYISIKELKEFLKNYKCFEIKTTGVIATFGRNEYQRKYLSVIDELILNKLCPDNWKYIGYGIAEK